MSILLDVAAYSALRTRGNIKVARETALINELGVYRYDQYKQEQRDAKRSRQWKFLFWLLAIGFPPFWPIAFIAIVYKVCKRDRAS